MIGQHHCFEGGTVVMRGFATVSVRPVRAYIDVVESHEELSWSVSALVRLGRVPRAKAPRLRPLMRDRSTDQFAKVLREDGTVVCERCVLATTMWPRMKGLLGRKELPPGEGVYLRPASSIHMFFMRFPIDAVFLDRQLVVRKVARELKPWRIAGARGSQSVIELASGEATRRGIEPGQQLEFGEPAQV